MSDAPELRPTPLRARREATIQILVAEFAQDHLTLEEFEQRLDVAHRATAITELDALVADLQRSPASETGVVPAPASVPATDVRENQLLVAVMGGVERLGRWIPARRNNVLACMGGAELDFREAMLGPGVTEVTIACLMGGVEIIIPPGMAVDMGGVAIMGAFAHMSTPPSKAGPNAPVLKINGFVLMGGVEVYVRKPGETAKDARRREKQERKRGDPVD